MKKSFSFVACFLALLLAVPAAWAGERAVLLPVTGPLTVNEKAQLAEDVVTGLSGRYELVHGEEVDRFVKQAFEEENHKRDCDEASCYRRIAAQYHADKIAAVRVAQIAEGQFLLTFNLYDVMTGEMTISRSKECKDCSFVKLKAIGSELFK